MHTLEFLYNNVNITRTPEEWCNLLNVDIIDPDGWRVDNKPMDEPISLFDFVQRIAVSTTMFIRNSDTD